VDLHLLDDVTTIVVAPPIPEALEGKRKLAGQKRVWQLFDVVKSTALANKWFAEDEIHIM